MSSLILGIVFLATYVDMRNDIVQVQRDGKAAEIEPIVNYTRQAKAFFSAYRAEIRFRTDEGKAIKIPNKEISFDLIDQSRRGGHVSIFYLASEPTKAYFPQESANALVLGFGLLFLFAGVAMVIGAFVAKSKSLDIQ